MSKRGVSRKMLIIAICIVIIVVTAIIGYYYIAQPFAKAREVLIGQVVSLTGSAAGFGIGYQWGALKAIEDINKLGGVLVEGRRVPVRLITYDDGSDPAKTSALAVQLVTIDNVIALLGSGPPTFNNPLSVVADKYETPFICAGPFEPWWVAGPYKYAWNVGFRIGQPVPAGDPRAGKRGYTILDVFFSFTDKFADQTNRKVAVLALDDADGRGWYMIFGPALKERGYEPYEIERNFGLYPPGTTDFSSLILAWKEAKCEILWGNLPGVDFGVLWRQAAALGWRPKMAIIGRAALFYEDVSAWGGDLPLGIATEIWWDPAYPYSGIGGRTSKSLAEEWVKEMGYFVNRIAGFGGYAYTQLLLDAIEKAGTLDKKAINKAIGESTATILTGPVRFTDMHDSPVPLVLGQWVKTDKPWIWECPIVYSDHPEIKPTHEPIFPLPPS